MLHTQPIFMPPSLLFHGFSLQQTQRPRFSPSKLPVPFLCTSCHYVCSSTQDSIKNHHCGLELSFLTPHLRPTSGSTLHRHLAPSSPRASRWSKSYCPEHQAEASILGLSVASPALFMIHLLLPLHHYHHLLPRPSTFHPCPN